MYVFVGYQNELQETVNCNSV